MITHFDAPLEVAEGAEETDEDNDEPARELEEEELIGWADEDDIGCPFDKVHPL